MARYYLEHRIGTGCNNRCAVLAREVNTRCVRQNIGNEIHRYCADLTETSIGAAAFDYDFGALEDTDNKLTKSYTNLMCESLSSATKLGMTVVFHSYAAFGSPSKGLMFILDSFKWAPAGSATWIFDRLNHPGMSNIRENRIYAHEVARKLIEEKRQELKNGTPGRDLLSSLGSSAFRLRSSMYDLKFSFLVKASHSPRQDLRLSDEEIIPQVR